MSNIWLDGMMGLVVGDALGCPVQFKTRAEIRNRKQGPVIGMEEHGTYDMPAGTWTDDSSMALATLDSIIQNGAIDADDIMRKFCDWEVNGAYTPFGFSFDEGNTCAKAIICYRGDCDTTTCGQTGEYSNGNGALMRIMPVCLYFYNKQKKLQISDKEAIDGIDLISVLTHNHLRSQMCCGLYYFMAKSILEFNEEKETDIQSILQRGADWGLKYYGKDTQNLAEIAYMARLFDLNELKILDEDSIRSTGYVVHSFEAAVWSLITTNTFRDCLLKAVNLGDDTDTVAAIAGGLAGLYYGYDEIPGEWLCVIKKREWIEGLCKRA